MKRKPSNSAEEEYLKAILSLSESKRAVRTTDIAKALGVSPASVTGMLDKLSKKKCVSHSPYHGVTLTKKGKTAAEKTLRSYQLLERFFVEYLKVPPSEARQQACIMEHCISKETERRICQIMKHPDFDMGNKPMPKCRLGKSCEACMDDFPMPATASKKLAV
jgi:DtxR family Mn-dependent transcriptional regulator